MTWELAWLVHREIELGQTVNPVRFGRLVRALRTATQRATQAASMRGPQVSRIDIDHHLRHYGKRPQDVLCYAYARGEWWRLDVWNPTLDRRIPQREHEPNGRHIANFTTGTPG
jgi:hypothetical protein